jgi:hypothetical protein
MSDEPNAQPAREPTLTSLLAGIVRDNRPGRTVRLVDPVRTHSTCSGARGRPIYAFGNSQNEKIASSDGQLLSAHFALGSIGFVLTFGWHTSIAATLGRWENCSCNTLLSSFNCQHLGAFELR